MYFINTDFNDLAAVKVMLS